MDKLRVLFSGYADMLPTAFVFCGHFCSAPYGPEHARTVKSQLFHMNSVLVYTVTVLI